MQLLSVAEALSRARDWSNIAALGDSDVPVFGVDLRNVERAFRINDQDQELARLLTAAPWVNVAVVDDGLDPVFAALVGSFDVIIGDRTSSEAAVDVDDVDGAVAELASCVEASPQASVELVRLLRTSHDLPIAQALHLESLTYAMLQTSATYQRWLLRRTTSAAAATRDEPTVRIELAGSLLRITLNRPEKRNALNTTMRDQLTEALELLDVDQSIDGALLAGAGANFSAGGDLDEFGSTPSPATGHQVRMMRSLPALMNRVSKRLRVHVHGTCVGAGIELPGFAASVIAHPDATFRLPEIAFGLIPGAGGTVSLTRRCGRHRTAWLALTGVILDAEQALRWQLVDRIDESVF